MFGVPFAVPGFGIGTPSQDFGSADAWQGAPMDGVDFTEHLQDSSNPQSKSSRGSEDMWLAVIILGSLVALWLLGGVGFKNARL